MSHIAQDKITDFIRSFLPLSDDRIEKIAQECRNEWIPLVQPEVGQFLQVLLRTKKAKRILEIGTGIGYSTILMARSLTKEGHITTIEIDQNRYERAVSNFKDNNVAHMVTPLLGDANEVLESLQEIYDFVFLDAAKGQYPEMFLKIWPLLEPGGVMVMDNIFLNGWVIDMTWPERRKKTMVVRMREILQTITAHQLLDTSIIPMGDGIAVCVRRSEHEKG